jgi:hypothetical protein
MFDVYVVTDTYVVVAPRGGRDSRRIPRSAFEAAYRFQAQGVELIPSVLEERGIVTRNSSYIIAILQAAQRVAL